MASTINFLAALPQIADSVALAGIILCGLAALVIYGTTPIKEKK